MAGLTRDRLAPLALVVMATVAATCGGNGAASTDAGRDAGGAIEAGAPGCDPAAQNCAATQKCDFGCEGTVAVVSCRPNSGAGAPGSACSAEMPCAKGNTCVSAATVGPVCRKYCATDTDCATGERCHNVTVTVACGSPATALLLHYCE